MGLLLNTCLDLVVVTIQYFRSQQVVEIVYWV